MLQVALAASVDPHALLPVATAKSVGLLPARAMLLMVSVALPVLESVAASADDVAPTMVLGKASVGVSVATGVAAAVPVPVSVDDCVVGVALSVTVNVAEKLAADAGVKVT
jgi:hypothetical protein